MKKNFNITRILLALCLPMLLALPFHALSQTNFKGINLPIAVKGTSSLHDWEMKSSKAECTALITIGTKKITLTELSFSVPVESLKSGKGGMDKNAYKAMNTKKDPRISFVFVSVSSITSTVANSYQVNGIGKLTIGGITKVTPMSATLNYNPIDKTLTCIGSKSFNMSEYGIKPPTALLGTIKTGDPITINYNFKLKS